MKEALKKHLESLGYSAEQITAILNGIQEPEQPTLKSEELGCPVGIPFIFEQFQFIY